VKKLLLLIVLAACFTSFTYATWHGLYGYVVYKNSGNPASYAKVIIDDGSSIDTVECNVDGYYEYTTGSGTYDLTAKLNNYVGHEYDVYYGGGPGGLQVDTIEIEIPNK